MKNIAIQLVKTYNELNNTLHIMQKDKNVTPIVFNKILDTRTNIHSIIMTSLNNLNYKETREILNKIIRK